MAYETIAYEVAEQILTITLNRPDKLNAFNAQMQKERIEAFDAAEKVDTTRPTILPGPARGWTRSLRAPHTRPSRAAGAGGGSGAGARLASVAAPSDRAARRGPVKRL